MIGLLPSAKQINTFVADKHSDKHERLMKTLLADNFNYALNWMSSGTTRCRNDYRGTGYIDGRHKQMTRWLIPPGQNMPYDRFVAELVDPTPDSEGFKGIVWRGAINASQTPQMQTAQNISRCSWA